MITFTVSSKNVQDVFYLQTLLDVSYVRYTKYLNPREVHVVEFGVKDLKTFLYSFATLDAAEELLAALGALTE